MKSLFFQNIRFSFFLFIYNGYAFLMADIVQYYDVVDIDRSIGMVRRECFCGGLYAKEIYSVQVQPGVFYIYTTFHHCQHTVSCRWSSVFIFIFLSSLLSYFFLFDAISL